MIGTALAVGAATWGVVMALSPLLQIRRMLSTRSSEDVSIGYFIVLLVGFLLWVAYGVSIRNYALIVPNTVALVTGVVTVVIATVLRKPIRREHGP